MTEPRRKLLDDGLDVVGRVANETVEGLGRVARRFGLDDAPGSMDPSRRDAFSIAVGALGLAGDWLADAAGAAIESFVGDGAQSDDGPAVLRARVGVEASEALIPLCVTNLGASSAEDVTFTCTPLFGPAGRELPVPRIDPVGITPFAEKGTRVRIPLGPKPRPGTYVGLLRAVDADAWAVVEVVVDEIRPPRRRNLTSGQAEHVVAEVSGQAAAIVAEGLPGALKGGGPRSARVTAQLADYPSRAGKAMRPALCLAACRAHGGESDATREVMLALELVHNAFLVHDDVEDDSRTRRGAPTLHEEHGTSAAVSIGDLLCGIAAERIGHAAQDMPSVAGRLFAEFTNILRRSSEGQAAEIAMRSDGDVVLDEGAYLRLVLDKTAWYTTIHPVRMGAIVGSRGGVPDEVLDDLTRYGVYLGAAFQVLDDLENLVGGVGYGKDRGSDIREGKPTLMLAHLFSTVGETDEGRRLRSLVGPTQTPEAGPSPHAGIDDVVAAMRRSGSLEHAAAKVAEYADDALAILDSAFRGARPTADVRYFEALPLSIKERARLLDVQRGDTDGAAAEGGAPAPAVGP